MYDMTFEISSVIPKPLDTEMQLQFGANISGISYDEDVTCKFRVHFYDPFTSADKSAAQAILDAHDPVFIQAERSGDTITVTVTKPRNLDAATELTLTVDDTPLPEATALTDNTATVLIESADEITLGILEDYPHTEVTI